MKKILLDIYKGRMKSSYDNNDDFFDQWDASTAAPMKEVCGPLGGNVKK